MRVAKLQTRIAMLAALSLSASSCQTVQKPVALRPPGTAPALTATVPTPQPPQQAQPAPQATPPKPKVQPESSPEAKAQAPPSTPPSDPVGDLIVKVEKDYQAGLDAYHAGRTDVAKQDFDHAFNALLESNLDIRSDDRLEKEFDRIVEGVNHLDLSALGFASDSNSDAQKAEPAPIDETNDITVPTDAKVKAKAQAEIKSTHSDLPLMMTDQVAGYISYFSNRGRGTFERA